LANITGGQEIGEICKDKDGIKVDDEGYERSF
jgi:hypothetical protein